jgi:predicted Zn-dependent protease
MELEADQFALNQLLTHQINPEGLPDFFSKLEEEEADKGTDKIPAIFKTHPATPERIEELEADIPDDYTVDPDRKERLASLFKSLREAIGAPQEDIDLELDSLDVHVDGDSSHFNMHVRVRE